MFYQVNLLKKKGQFGVVWLAAHYPTRLTKNDIITFDLENKWYLTSLTTLFDEYKSWEYQ
jgi:hypothetical protein